MRIPCWTGWIHGHGSGCGVECLSGGERGSNEVAGAGESRPRNMCDGTEDIGQVNHVHGVAWTGQRPASEELAWMPAWSEETACPKNGRGFRREQVLKVEQAHPGMGADSANGV